MCSFSAPRGLAEVLATPGKVSSCGRTEVAGDWWAVFVARNGRVRLEEFTAHWDYISGFSSHTLVHGLVNVDVVSYPTL